MSKADTVADTLLRLAKQTEHLTIAADLLKQYGSLENAVTEQTKLLDQSTENLVLAQKEYKDFVENVTKEKEDILAEIAASKKEAKDIVAKAKEKSKAMIDETEATCAAKLVELNSISDIRTQELRDTLTKLQDEIDVNNTRLTALGADIAAKNSELDALDAQLTKARNSIAKLSATVEKEIVK